MSWWEIVGSLCPWLLVLSYWREARRERENARAWEQSANRILRLATEAIAAEPTPPQRADPPPRPPNPFELIHGMRGRKTVCEPDGTRRGYLLIDRGSGLEWIDAWVRLPYELTILVAGQA